MWNRSSRKEELPPRPEPAPAGAPGGPAREAIPTSAYSSRRSEEPTTRTAALVGKSLVVTGKISGKEDLVVDGRVEGDIDLPENCLTVGNGGHVQGAVRAREIVVYGAVQGNMEASERIQIRRSARVVGDLRTARPVIEEEAYFKGNIETVRTEKVVAQQRPAAGEAPAQQASLPNAAPAFGDPRRG
jgi:cytoskeletal protein CcmA (bactofilin family)